MAAGLGAATLGTLMHGEMKAAPVLGLGTLAAYGSYRLSLRREERRRERQAAR